MSNVLEFKQPKVTGTKPRLPALPVWFCTRCDSEEFRLYESGAIHCCHCHSLIRGISVEKT